MIVSQTETYYQICSVITCVKAILLTFILLYSSLAFGESNIDPDIQVKIKGLVCPSCAIGIKIGLKKRTEIKKLNIDVKKQSIFIEYWNVEIHPSLITNIVKNAGYEVTSIKWLKDKAKPNRYNAP